MSKQVFHEHLICQCSSPEHTLQLVYFGDPHGQNTEENDPNIYGVIHLNHFSFWKRLWTAIKYVFGYGSRFGHFGEFMLRPEDLDKLIRVLDTTAPEPMLTEGEAMNKLKLACQGKQDDTACCAVAGLMAAGRKVDAVEDANGLTICVRNK